MNTPWTEAWDPEFRSPPWKTLAHVCNLIGGGSEGDRRILWYSNQISMVKKTKAKTLVMTHKLTSGINVYAHTGMCTTPQHIHSSARAHTHMHTCLHMHGCTCSYTLTLKNTLPGEEGRKILAFRVHQEDM